MFRKSKRIITGFMAATFLLGTPSVQAVMGIRIARKAIMARKAKQELAMKPDPTDENKSLEDLKRLEQESKKI